MSPRFLFLRPLDVLYLHGHRAFGTPGSPGETLMPPWPSVAAGALRSRILVDHRVDVTAFGQGLVQPPEPLQDPLGTPAAPGRFRVSHFTLARGRDPVEVLLQAPADVVVFQRNGTYQPHGLAPTPLEGLSSSWPLPQIPLLRVEAPDKPVSGLWLTQRGFARYLDGGLPGSEELVPQSQLWTEDPRLGIALDSTSRTAARGLIYTARAIVVQDSVGFLVGVTGADAVLPEGGLVRLGGEGRAAEVRPVAPSVPEPPWEEIARQGRFRLVLATAGLFPGGWRLPGLKDQDSSWIWEFPGGSARLCSATLGRHRLVTGWDLAAWRPKAALRAVPPGTVYWLDRLQGGVEPLKALLGDGLWFAGDLGEPQRRPEGFNNVFVAVWAPTHPGSKEA